ncbi:hypothetical protein FV139_13775 [Parahaliea maris]|uniref:Uncharacterized protein n=1 Tax=Parahaliea maris TaxID=2716870 RepID=A0A5C8ZZ47_9GAMM|nr:hypothetical protein [Parahaliea maris]TXS93014.1 hypothetical protein FV139_13775 [Parahaliea maris]
MQELTALSLLQWLAVGEFLIMYGISLKLSGRGYVPGLCLCLFGTTILIIKLVLMPLILWTLSPLAQFSQCSLRQTLHAETLVCGRAMGSAYACFAAAGTAVVWQFIAEKVFDKEAR